MKTYDETSKKISEKLVKFCTDFSKDLEVKLKKEIIDLNTVEKSLFLNTFFVSISGHILARAVATTPKIMQEELLEKISSDFFDSMKDMQESFAIMDMLSRMLKGED